SAPARAVSSVGIDDGGRQDACPTVPETGRRGGAGRSPRRSVPPAIHLGLDSTKRNRRKNTPPCQQGFDSRAGRAGAKLYCVWTRDRFTRRGSPLRRVRRGPGRWFRLLHPREGRWLL